MKHCIFSGVLALASLVSVTSAHADLNFTFDGDAQEFTGGSWAAGRQAFQATNSVGGWNLGSSVFHEFAWPEQVDMQTLANSGNARISFTLSVDGGSWTPGVAQWFQLHYSGNSDGAAGWTQDGGGGDPVNSWHNADDNALYSWTFDHSFTQMGWQAGDSWFQFYVGANSDGAAPVRFYIDDVHVYAVPEPTLSALLAIAGMSAWFKRRRH